MCIQRFIRLIVVMDLILFLCFTIGFAQITFEKTYGGTEGDEGFEIQQASNGDYIILANITSYNPPGIWLIKTDSLGNTLWEKSVENFASGEGASFQQTTDKGYIIVGSTPTGAYTYGAYLLKTDSLGNLVWSRIYEFTGFGDDVEQLPDGGYIFLSGNGTRLTRVDSLGDTIWSRRYSVGAGEALCQTTDGGYVVTGWGGVSDVFLLKTDSLGDTMWSKTYGESGKWSGGGTVQQTTDGGYIVIGAISAADIDSPPDVYLVKTDSLGNLLWSRTFGGDDTDVGNDVKQTRDGGYIIVGYTSSFGDWRGDVYLIKTDSLGNVYEVGVEEKDSSSFKCSFALHPSYPNPFVEITEIRYEITDKEQSVTPRRLKIFDVTGRSVRQWDDRTVRQSDKIIWRGEDDSGHKLPAGVYFYRLEFGATSVTRKLVKLK